MPPSLALLLWLVLLLGLLRYDRVKDASLALWVPVIYLAINASRLPSSWLGGSAAQTLEDGNSLDRAVYLALMFLAIAVLTSRSFKWLNFFRRNLALTGFLGFALVSTLWSDYAFVAFKRWIRDSGQYFMILLALSDPRPVEAVRVLFRRVCFLMIPLSILLYKYYPEVGKQYEFWTGQGSFVGVTTSKNMLGLLCLLSGLFFLWDTQTHWADRKEGRTKKILYVNVSMLAMTLWLLYLSNSATSRVCFLFGCFVLWASHNKTLKSHPAILTTALPVGFCLYALLAFGFGVDINAVIAAQVGRDPTLTGRTHIWYTELATNTNPFVGTGYESFWLGPRLQWVWERAGEINEAHNGYLHIYLNLGFVGVVALIAFLMAGYWNICQKIAAGSRLGTLGLVIWSVLLFYNMTEAAFPTGLLWVTLLTGALDLPEPANAPLVVEAGRNGSLSRPLSRRDGVATTGIARTQGGHGRRYAPREFTRPGSSKV